MNCLVEFYDDSGRCFESFRADDELDAIRILALRIERWRGLGFRNASCYVNQKEIWNLEIKS